MATVDLKRSKRMAMNLIRESAAHGALNGELWRDDKGSLVNPATTLFLLDEIQRLQDLVKTLATGQNDYSRGYKDGYEDGLTAPTEDENPLGWAIVDRVREKVCFDPQKPTQLQKDQTVIPLFARGEATKKANPGL